MKRLAWLGGTVLLTCTACQPRSKPQPQPQSQSQSQPQPQPQSQPQPHSTPPTVETLSLPDRPVPGFVLYSQGATVLLSTAVDELEPQVLRSTGHWIQDESGDEPVVRRRYDPRFDESLPFCPCAEIEGECLEGATTTVVEGVVHGSCACRQLLSEPVRAMPLEIDGVEYEACRDDLGESAPVSLVGGTLFVAGWMWNGACYGGLNLYDSASWDIDLEGARRREFPARTRFVGCTYDWGPVMVASPASIIDDEGVWDQGEACKGDFEYAEGESWSLRRGNLWHISESQSGAGGWLGARRTKATPEACPSANDPCGDPKPFSFAGLGPKPEFWVDNSGAFALTGRGINYRIHVPGQDELPEPVAVEGFDVREQLIGVRAHADLRPLIRMMRTNPAPARLPPPDPGTCPTGTLHPLDADLTDPKVLGNRCVTRFRDHFYSSAEAACRHGLERVEDDKVRGALLYNLAQIAKARRVPEYAKVLLERSLEVRPGNRATQADLRAIERQLGSKE